MKKRKFFLVGFILLFLFVLVGTNNDLKFGSTKDLYEESQIVAFLEKEYTASNKRYVSSNRSLISDILDTKNLSQSALNDYYYAKKQQRPNGTCSVVAVTSVIEYCSRVLNAFDIESTIEETYVNILDTGIKKGHTSLTSGTSQGTIDNLLEDAFKLYGCNYKADNDYFGLYDHMKTEIDAKRPVIFSIPNHSTVCKGYAEYKVEYSYRNWQQKWIKKTATEKFFVVDDGWGSSFYRYFPNSLAQDKTKFGNTRFIIN